MHARPAIPALAIRIEAAVREIMSRQARAMAQRVLERRVRRRIAVREHEVVANQVRDGRRPGERRGAVVDQQRERGGREGLAGGAGVEVGAGRDGRRGVGCDSEALAFCLDGFLEAALGGSGFGWGVGEKGGGEGGGGSERGRTSVQTSSPSTTPIATPGTCQYPRLSVTRSLNSESNGLWLCFFSESGCCPACSALVMRGSRRHVSRMDEMNIMTAIQEPPIDNLEKYRDMRRYH